MHRSTGGKIDALLHELSNYDRNYGSWIVCPLWKTEMTPFTDEDLKRLREDIEMAFSCNGQAVLKGSLLNALLARLEAAEKCIENIEANDPSAYRRSREAWRKSKGEEK